MLSKVLFKFKLVLYKVLQNNLITNHFVLGNMDVLVEPKDELFEVSFP